MSSIKINPITQIRWELWQTTVSGVPMIAVSPHGYTHSEDGSDPIYISTTQVTGLNDVLSVLPHLLYDNTSATVSGSWEFASTLESDLFTSPQVTANYITFVPMHRPETLNIGELYMDMQDNKLYMGTSVGPKSFHLIDVMPPLVKSKFALSLGLVAGNPRYASGLARLFVYRGAYGQSLGQIKNSYKQTGQSRVRIRRLLHLTGQAQATIYSVHTYRSSGQALAEIYAGVGTQYSLARVLIEKPYPNLGHALAQSKINAFGTTSHGLAIAFIDYI